MPRQRRGRDGRPPPREENDGGEDPYLYSDSDETNDSFDDEPMTDPDDDDLGGADVIPVMPQVPPNNAQNRARRVNAAPRLRRWHVVHWDRNWDPRNLLAAAPPPAAGVVVRPRFAHPAIGYIEGQWENGPIARNTGQNGLHWQGYVELTVSLNGNQVAVLLGLNNGQHFIEGTRFSREANLAYVRKMETRANQNEAPQHQPVRFAEGVMANMNARESYASAAALAQTGALPQQIADQHPEQFVRYSTGLQKLSLMNRKPGEREVTIKVYWGETGSGKSRRAHDEAAKLGIALYEPPDNTNFMDGYNGEEGLLLDEFSCEAPFTLAYLNKLLDRYARRINTKGSHEFAAWTYVWICSNIDPKDWYTKETGKTEPEKKRKALMRRLTQNDNRIIEMNTPWQPPTTEELEAAQNPALQSEEQRRLEQMEREILQKEIDDAVVRHNELYAVQGDEF